MDIVIKIRIILTANGYKGFEIKYYWVAISQAIKDNSMIVYIVF